MSEQVNRVTDEVDETQIEKGLNDPIMPFDTSYMLDKNQEDELIQHAMQRLKDLESELGREDGMSSAFSDTPDPSESYDEMERAQRSFMGKRRIYDLTYRNKVGWRAHVIGGIYKESNLTLPVSRRITRQMIAKANNYFFSTDPWFAAYPVGNSDSPSAELAGKYAKIKMEEAKLKQSFEASVERAFISGECVLKTGFLDDAQIYKTYQGVLVDAEGFDILDANENYITEDALWVPLMAANPDTGEEYSTEDFVLKHDGETPKPAELLYEEKLVTRKKTLYTGTKTDIVHYRDFLCPLKAESVQEADCIIHLYDMPVMDLAESWKKAEVLEGATQSEQSTAEAINLIRKMASETGTAKSEKNGVRPEMNDAGEKGEPDGEPVAEIAEFYLKYDANGDGIMEDIMIQIDRKSESPIFYDYVANLTDDGLRPFTVDRVNPVEGRWYGEGSMEMFESSQNIIDKSVNRWNFSQMGSGRVDFWNPEATVEGRHSPDLALNMGGTYTLLPGKLADDALQSVNLHDVKYQEVQGMFELFMQSAMNESGVGHANDNNVAGMQTTKLATGIRNIEKTGNEMFSVYLGHLEPGITETLRKAIAVMYANLEEGDVVSYMEDDADQVISIAANEIRDIEMDVKVTLSKYKDEQVLESSSRASELVERFYALPPEVQTRVAGLYRNMLKAMQIPNADSYIDPVPVQEMSVAGDVDVSGGATTPQRRPQENL
tara:strand:- start:17027 stop:19183 length:2157 start_codon:yes stop_codon:yes gene_type:complete